MSDEIEDIRMEHCAGCVEVSMPVQSIVNRRMSVIDTAVKLALEKIEHPATYPVLTEARVDQDEGRLVLRFHSREMH